MLAGSPAARPDLRHLISEGQGPEIQAPKGYFCVMPGSKWASKRWAPEKFLRVIRSTSITPVILGGPKDSESYELIELLMC